MSLVDGCKVFVRAANDGSPQFKPFLREISHLQPRTVTMCVFKSLNHTYRELGNDDQYE